MPYYPNREPESSGERDDTRTTEGKKTLLSLFLLLVSCALILFSTVKLILYNTELSGSRNTSRELRQIYDGEGEETTSEAAEAADTPGPRQTEQPETAAPEVKPVAEAEPAPEAESISLPAVPYPDNPELRVPERFLRLRRKAIDIVGWLKADQLDEAVVQRDNSFFLDHDAAGNRNSNGAIFMDQSIGLATRPYTLILYGHNMKSGNMFGRMKKYKQSSYFYSHQILSFDSMYEEGRYAVFAVMEMSTLPGSAAWYNLWSLTTDNRKEREEAIRLLERRSAVAGTLDVRADDQILLLVTCMDGEDDRLVVAARRLREGEREDQLTLRSP